jgi:hypothetical protein
MLWQSGFRQLARGDGTRIELTEEYMVAYEANA